MSMITVFADQLFSFLALKYEVIDSENPGGARIPAENYDWSDSDEFTLVIGRAVLMLSYSYRTAFRKHFNNLLPLLNTSKAVFYPVIFANVTYQSHSPLKILVLCAFISEMHLFLIYKNGSRNTITDYLKPSVAAFDSVYRSVLSLVDDPILKWNDVKRVAGDIADGYEHFRPLMESEHPSEDKDFFTSVESLVNTVESPAEAAREADLLEQDNASQKLPVKKKLIPKVIAAIPSASSEVSPSQDAGGKTALNKNATLGARSSGASSNPDSKVEKSSKTPPQAKPSVSEHGLKKNTTASNTDKLQAKGKVTSDSSSTIDKSASNIPGIDEKGEADLSKKSKSYKRRMRAKAKLAEKKAAKDGVSIKEETKDLIPPDESNVKECLSKFSRLTAKDTGTDSEKDEQDSGEELFV